MKIYVASSWRNELQPEIVAALREIGHEVYDFKNPPSGTGFSWTDVAPDWKITDGAKGFVEADAYRKMLAHPIAASGYKSDIDEVRGADAVVCVLPCGRSASWEFGYIMGQGKPGYVIWFGPHEPELMFREATIIGSMEELQEVFTIQDTLQQFAYDLGVKHGLKMVKPNCDACAYSGLNATDFVCFHKDAGPFGKLARIAIDEGGHCGPLRPKFKQHPGRNPDGSLKRGDDNAPA